MRPLPRLVVLFLVAATAGSAWAAIRPHGSSQLDRAIQSLPRPPAPALRVGVPRVLAAQQFESRWAVLLTRATARAQPGSDAPAVLRLSLHAPEGTPNALQVLRSRADAAGRLWVEVSLPTLPNGRTGWLPRRALGGYQAVDTQLVVDRNALRVVLYRKRRPIFSAPVGVGTSASPTPTGTFLVRSRLTRYASPFYGPVAFGTTARSAVLTDWPDGGFIGIHGTNAPDILPGRVSHGCIRLRNADIVRLAHLMPVGTPVTIR
jgi:lipoprotein-anchoring transpeptidase ErfK/SrfK